MSEVDKPLDDKLSELYQEHKQKTHVPRYLKHQVMVTAKRANKKQTKVWQSTTWLSAFATIAVLAILVNMSFIRKGTVDRFDELATNPPKRAFAINIVHRLESEAPIITAKEQREQKLEKIYQDYQRRKLAYTVHRQETAELVAVSDGWSLKTCDEQVVQISPKLVSLFVDWERIESDIALGDQVDIAFDEQGRITKISRITELARC